MHKAASAEGIPLGDRKVLIVPCEEPRSSWEFRNFGSRIWILASGSVRARPTEQGRNDWLQRLLPAGDPHSKPRVANLLVMELRVVDADAEPEVLDG